MESVGIVIRRSFYNSYGKWVNCMSQIGALVSVIVPIYKVEKYLQQCIDSICLQTYPLLEIILIDDGSPDGCGNICDQSAAEDSRIKIIHKKNGGLSSARNIGLDIATGEYIVFVDSDDTIHPKYIEILLGLCEEYDCDVAQCDFLCIAEDSVKLPLISQQDITFYDNKQAIHELCCGSSQTKFSVVWNKIYKRNLFDKIRYPIGRIHEDEFTTYQVLWNIKQMVVTKQYLYYYLQRDDSITGEKYSIKRLDVLEAFRERLSFLKKRKLEDEYHCTLMTFYRLLEEHYILVRKNLSENKKVRASLFEEKEKIKKQIPEIKKKKSKRKVNKRKMAESCDFPIGSKIVLYGAGYWGNIYYHWIDKGSNGQVVGWVDNYWYTFSNTKCLVTPLDSLLHISCDYILIAIKSKTVQKEVAENLINWGISERKILFIDTEDVEE